MRTILLLVAALAAPAFAQGSIFPDKTTKAVARKFEPQAVAEDVKVFLRDKMKNHNKEMKDLSVAITTARLSEVQRFAQDIANQPRLDPATGPAVKLAPRFFELQELTKKTAQELADAARANDMNISLEKYQLLVVSCTACHAEFKAQLEAPKKTK